MTDKECVISSICQVTSRYVRYALLIISSLNHNHDNHNNGLEKSNRFYLTENISNGFIGFALYTNIGIYIIFSYIYMKIFYYIYNSLIYTCIYPMYNELWEYKDTDGNTYCYHYYYCTIWYNSVLVAPSRPPHYRI